MTRLAIAIVVIIIACWFLWIASAYPTKEEQQQEPVQIEHSTGYYAERNK